MAADVRFSASDYLTHLIYLRGSRIPVDDPTIIENLGIKVIQVEPDSKGLFDEQRVLITLQAILRDD